MEDTQIQLGAIPLAKVHHVGRDANQAAHLLAKTSLLSFMDLVWIGEFPSPIHNIVLAEQVFIP